MKYSWDPRKAAENKRKHGVSFEDAIGAIEDEHAVVSLDQEHGETRLNYIGYAYSQRLVFVVACEVRGEQLQIISARKANPRERAEYIDGADE